LEAVELFNSLGRDDIALELARNGIRQNRDSGQAYVIYGMSLAGHGEHRKALEQLRAADSLFADDPRERQRVADLIATMRRAAPDSLRAVFVADSVAHLRRSPPAARPAKHP